MIFNNKGNDYVLRFFSALHSYWLSSFPGPIGVAQSPLNCDISACKPKPSPQLHGKRWEMEYGGFEPYVSGSRNIPPLERAFCTE